MTQGKINVSIWLRASDPSQHSENQLPELRAWAERRGFDVVKVYTVQESAWKGAHHKALTQVYQDARTGRFQILLVWALDRLSREGVAATLEIIERLGRYGVKVLSLQESWTEVEGPMQELLLSIVAWVARMESNRRSERTKAGLARAVSEGKRLGRPVGSKDKKKRSRRGYFARWAE
jgi:DNA invertase Pin-like site-specific DNA recombinase